MGAAEKSLGMGVQPPYRGAEVVKEDATVIWRSPGCALGETQATARGPEALSSFTASGVESSSSWSCLGHNAEEHERMVDLRELAFKKEDG
ncbi:hypothetical protein NHX12_028168 [Muraenolepis orangiensis]|uniref:Uncharacterized protein n=1 Tax=Muraenolepis orangiensis TaxID=630683 RepID=A0A9Q0D7H3_9TELE|nr:hypothetical protein NHX12_028168 [Muraenolepis orangiensis]